MGKTFILIVLISISGISIANVQFSPITSTEDVIVDTLLINGVEYHQLSIDGYQLTPSGYVNTGNPSLPYTAPTFLLNPNIQVNSIEILSEQWEAIPGKYYLYPVQPGLMTDTVFTEPDSAVYESADPFPSEPVEIIGQGSAMGYSVVTLAGTPVRYTPADSTVEILTKVTVHLFTGPAEYERISPNRETEFSAAMRRRGILSLVANPEDTVFYQSPTTMSFEDRSSYLNITQSPSPEGDGVDMVIITSEELAEAFEQVANYRTQQGIVTVIRTVEWIDQFYSGCDTQERMRNFLRDAHEEWGIQAVLLGGDADVVPVRECKGWDYSATPYPTDLLPSDDYYSDIDGSWSYGNDWQASSTDNYLDICVGRWPCDDQNDIDCMYNKLLIYEFPSIFPTDFARKMLLLGSNTVTGADDMINLENQLTQSGSVPDYLDYPDQLYYPHSLPQGDLNRTNALDAFDQGYNLICHADHSGIHEIGTASKGALGEAMYDYDFSTMGNENEPSILWSYGCDPGWFDGADCFAESGLFTNHNTGLVAAIVNSRYGLSDQEKTLYPFCDALFNTGFIAGEHGFQSLDWPLSYLGEAHRCSKNVDGDNMLRLNLLGSPLLFVWRDDPGQLSVSVPPVLLREGVPQDVTVTVRDEYQNPVVDATVCIWQENELFCVEETGPRGQATFQDICVTDASTEVIVTAVKRRRNTLPTGTTVVSYIPDQAVLEVLPSSMPIVSYEDKTVDAAGDGTANPGETLDIYVTATNSGGETAQYVTADVSIVSGQEYIQSFPDDHMGFPDIASNASEESSDPITIEIKPNTPSYSAVKFQINFTYEDGSGTPHEWESDMFLTIYSEDYQVTLLDPSVSTDGLTAELDITDMLLVNCGLGEASDLEITVDNIVPEEPFTVNTLTLSQIDANDCAEIPGQITLTVMPQKESPWLSNFERCSADIVVNSNGGSFVARTIDVSAVDEYQNETLQSPFDLLSYEAGQDYLSLHWKQSTSIPIDGFYVYCDQNRVFPMPVPVTQATVNDLTAGNEYDIDVTAVDIIGRESIPVSEPLSTVCPLVSGWPLQLEGTPCGGPASADIDNDGNDEIIVATSYGYVYIIERNGSYYTLSPPAGYDFDRFLGCAVGDVDNDSNLEIVVTCQKGITIQGEEMVSVLLFDKSGMIWNVDEIASSDPNEEVYSPPIAGTPVLLQADGSGYLEIALRTRKGSYGSSRSLYVWMYDDQTDSWDDYNSTDFPVELNGWCYGAPTAVDFDGDGCEEILLTEDGEAGVGTSVKIVDFDTFGNVTITDHPLDELYAHDITHAYSTLAVAEENGTYYLAGIAKDDVLVNSAQKLAFVYSISTGPVSLTHVWDSNEWLSGKDFYDRLTGPSIGDIDGDSDLEVLYVLNGESGQGEDDDEGVLYAWDLTDGSIDYCSDPMQFNPIVGGGGAHVKSQPVIGLTTAQGSQDRCVFTGFASNCYGYDLSNTTGVMAGFPSWTRDEAFPSPMLCDLDGDGIGEILYIDYSGYASLFDWDGYYTEDGWHMYQDNPHRNGFYNYDGIDRGSGVDIRIVDAFLSAEQSRECSNQQLLVEIEIDGYPDAIEDIATIQDEPEPISIVQTEDSRAASHAVAEGACEQIVSSSISSIASSSQRQPVDVAGIPAGVVDLAVFDGDHRIGTAEIPLISGSHTVEIPLASRINSVGDLRVVADPFNEIDEMDETNNISVVETASFSNGALQEMFIPSPARSIQLSLNLATPITNTVSVKVYSLDGRLVCSSEFDNVQSGTSNLSIGAEEELPTGILHCLY